MGDRNFDCIVFNEVLEHCSDPFDDSMVPKGLMINAAFLWQGLLRAATTSAAGHKRFDK